MFDKLKYFHYKILLDNKSKLLPRCDFYSDEVQNKHSLVPCEGMSNLATLSFLRVSEANEVPISSHI